MNKILLNFGNESYLAIKREDIDAIEIRKGLEVKTQPLNAVYEFKKFLFFFKKKECIRPECEIKTEKVVYSVAIVLNVESNLAKARSKCLNPFLLSGFEFEEKYLKDFINQLNNYNLIEKFGIKEN